MTDRYRRIVARGRFSLWELTVRDGSREITTSMHRVDDDSTRRLSDDRLYSCDIIIHAIARSLILTNVIHGLTEFTLFSLSPWWSHSIALTEMSNSSPYSLTHLKNFPPKNWTPIIEKISQNTRQTRSTLNILGIAYINAFTTICEPGRKIFSVIKFSNLHIRIITFFAFRTGFLVDLSAIFTLMPCHLEIALSGLRARSVLSDRNTLRFSFSSIKRLNMDTCAGGGVGLIHDLPGIVFMRDVWKSDFFACTETHRASENKSTRRSEWIGQLSILVYLRWNFCNHIIATDTEADGSTIVTKIFYVDLSRDMCS